MKTIITQTVATIGPIELSAKADNINAKAETVINPMAANTKAAAYRHNTSSVEMILASKTFATYTSLVPNIRTLNIKESAATQINNQIVYTDAAKNFPINS